MPRQIGRSVITGLFHEIRDLVGFMTVTEGSPGGNMEGKETLFGPEGSALMTVGTMGTTAGATDSALDSYTPVGGTLRTEKERAGKWLTATAG